MTLSTGSKRLLPVLCLLAEVSRTMALDLLNLTIPYLDSWSLTESRLCFSQGMCRAEGSNGVWGLGIWTIRYWVDDVVLPWTRVVLICFSSRRLVVEILLLGSGEQRSLECSTYIDLEFDRYRVVGCWCGCICWNAADNISGLNFRACAVEGACLAYRREFWVFS